MKEHRGHTFNDPGETYAEKIALCHNAISKIQKNYLQTFHYLKEREREQWRRNTDGYGWHQTIRKG